MHIIGLLRHLPLVVRVFPLACAMLGLLVLAPVSGASFPGQNGDVAVTNDEECDQESNSIWTFDSNTGDLTGIYGNPAVENSREAPAWSASGREFAFSYFPGAGSVLLQTIGGGNQLVFPDGRAPGLSPDGTQVTFVRNNALAVVNVDGSGYHELLSGPYAIAQPRWSPDGTRIAFSSRLDGGTDQDIYVLTLATGSVAKLTDNAVGDTAPDWSPDGSQLVFYRQTSSLPSDVFVHRINATGSDESAPLGPAGANTPAWSPDGNRIAFTSIDGDIYSMTPSGADVQLQVHEEGFPCIHSPDWQPLPVNTASAFARPKGATPFRASLVPAFQACTSSNRTHGAPLAFPSCAPPAPGSSSLTVGVGDGSPALSKSIGSMRMDVMPTDVNLRMSLTNVMNASNLSDYTGQLHASMSSRLTDKEGTVASTRMDFPFGFDVPCTSTADTTLGGDCRIVTSFNSVLPGSATSGLRTNWEMGRFEVYDGTGALLATQGVFVP